MKKMTAAMALLVGATLLGGTVQGTEPQGALLQTETQGIFEKGTLSQNGNLRTLVQGTLVREVPQDPTVQETAQTVKKEDIDSNKGYAAADDSDDRDIYERSQGHQAADDSTVEPNPLAKPNVYPLKENEEDNSSSKKESDGRDTFSTKDVMTAIHYTLYIVPHEEFSDYYRGIHVKNGLGRVLLKYGPPQAIVTDETGSRTYFVYQRPTKEERREIYRRPYDGSPGTQLAHALNENPVLLFTGKDGAVESIQWFTPEAFRQLPLPTVTMRYFRQGLRYDDDFTVGGYRINDTFSLQKGTNRDWQYEGELWHNHFVESSALRVLYDDDHKIRKVFLGKGMRTRRGAFVGLNLIMLLLLYGPPMNVVRDVPFTPDKTDRVYQYKNPYALSEYLLFVFGKEDYIKAIILSDEPAEDIPKGDESLNMFFNLS